MKKLIKLVSLAEYINSKDEYLTYTQAVCIRDLLRLNPEIRPEEVYFCFHKSGYFRAGTLKQLRKSTYKLNERDRSLRRSLEEVT